MRRRRNERTWESGKLEVRKEKGFELVSEGERGGFLKRCPIYGFDYIYVNNIFKNIIIIKDVC